MWKNHIQRIHKCNRCENTRYKNLVNSKSKPYLDSKVYEDWIPEKDIKCLFIAESPPGGKGFFYKHQKNQKEGSLRKNLFSLLQIDKKGYDGLSEFKQRGFLLTDALKCRVNKKGRSIPKSIAKNCLEILEPEIEKLQKSKNVKKLVVLGKTALTALRMLGYSELEKVSVTKNCGKIVKSHGFEIFLCTLPFARTRNYWYKAEVKEELNAFVR